MGEVITTGAEKVWPDSVERVLAGHARVAEVAVWKRADPEWGERVVAWARACARVIPRGWTSCASWWPALSPWAAPKELELVTHPAAPRRWGKVRRMELLA